MVLQVGIALGRLLRWLTARAIQSSDEFTSWMVEKYGENFYEIWTPREQERYATLRLREEGVQRRGRPLGPITAFLCTSCAALVLAAIAASPLLPWWYHSTLNGGQQYTVAQADPDTFRLPSGESPQSVPPPPSPAENQQPVSPSDELKQVTPPKPISRSHEYYKAKTSPPPKLKPIVKENARAIESRAIKRYADGEFILASHLFEEIIQLGEATAATHNNLGCCLFRTARGNQAPALAEFSKAIALDPKNATIFENRGTAYYQDSKQIKVGRRDFATAAEMNVKRRLEKPGTPPTGFFELKQSRTSTRFPPTLRKRYSSVRVSTWQGRASVRRP
jgi:tetratricopeptide (TPR) repeat protein